MNVFLVAVLAVACWLLAAHQGGAQAGVLPPLGCGLYAVAAALLEAGCARLPTLGLMSGAPSVYVALFVLSPRWGLVLAPVLLALRSVLTGSGYRAREFWLDFFPISAAFAALALVRGPVWAAPLVAAQLYLALQVWGSPLLLADLPVEAREQFADVRQKLTPLLAVQVIAAWPLVRLGAAGLAVVPLLALLGSQAALLVRVQEEEARRRLQGQLVATSGQLQETRESEQRLRLDLQSKLEEYALLQELSSRLSDVSAVEEAMERLAGLLGRLVPFQRLAVFLVGEQGLEPRFQRGRATPPEATSLLQLREPCVEHAWARQEAVWQERAPVQARLFDDEQALALPMRPVGVLYLSAEHPFSPQQRALVGVVAAQAGIALLSASRFEEQRRLLESHAAARERLESWVSGLDQLLAFVGRTAALEEPERILAELKEALSAIVPHESHRLLLQPEGWDSVFAYGRPLLIEDLSSGRVPPLQPGERSLLIVPVGRAPTRAALALGSRQLGAFDRQDQDLLTLLAELADGAMQRAFAHAQLKEAYLSLQRSEAQLVQSSKLAAVGQLAAGVAHELNSPLGAILLCLDSARKAIPGKLELASKKLDEATRVLVRSQGIVEKLLYYSRDARVARVPTDLNEVVRDTLELTGPALAQAGVRVDCRSVPLPPVEANQNELQQVLINLLNNARDALRAAGSPEPILVETLVGEREVGLRVTDRGTGIGPDDLPRIFEPFYTTREIGEGTGLGLSVCQEIVRLHDGRIDVQSRPGATEMTVWLPLMS